MERVYRILTWGITGAECLLLMPFFFIGCMQIPDVRFACAALGLSYISLLYLGWKIRIRKDVVTEDVKTSRLYSFLLWTGFVLIVFTFLKISISCAGLNYFCGIRIDYPLFALLLAAAVFAGMRKPFRNHVKEKNFAWEGILLGILFFGWFYCFGAHRYDYSGKHLPAGYEMPMSMQKRFFPDGASDFEIKGASAFFAHSAEWSCHVPEKDFEKFRRKNGYHFVQNRTDVNEDKNMEPLNRSDAGWRKPYYFYNNRHRNGGGLTMRYSVPEQKLYGHYSNR